MSKKSTRGKKGRKSRIESEKRESFFGRLFKKLLLMIFVVLLILAGLFCLKTYQNGWNLKGALMTAFFVSPEEIENLDNINIVLLGISEDLDSRLTDTIMLCSYNPKTANVSMISIPRDTFTGKDETTAIGGDKLNVLFNKSHEKFMKEISSIVGFKVEHYAVVNNEALIKIVDIIGGVKFDVPIDMDYDDETQDLHIHLSKGMQKIDGKKAEQLLRFRHNNDGTSYPGNYGDNDFGRMKTQRAFIEETLKQLISIKNIFKAKRIYDAVLENVETNYDLSKARKYIPTLADFRFENITSHQLPGKSERLNELWFFVKDEQKIKELVKELEIN